MFHSAFYHISGLSGKKGSPVKFLSFDGQILVGFLSANSSNMFLMKVIDGLFNVTERKCLNV